MRTTPLAWLIIIVAGVASGCNAMRPGDDASSDFATAISLAGSDRRIAPRLSTDASYRTCHRQAGSTACAEAKHDLPTDLLLRVAHNASASLRLQPTAPALHAVGLIDLAWTAVPGKTLDRAIYQMEMASHLDPVASPVYADLSAAYIVRATLTGTAQDWVRAVESADVAVELDSNSLGARFNAILALDGAGLHGEAVRAANAYLARDTATGWASEIRSMVNTRNATVLTTLSPEPSPAEVAAYVSYAPQTASDIAWDSLFGAWGRARTAGDNAHAEAILSTLQAIGLALSDTAHDSLLADAADCVLREANDHAATAALARAHTMFARARTAYRNGAYDSTIAILAGIGSTSPPLRRMVAVSRSGALVGLARLDESKRSIAMLLAPADSGKYPLLTARARWTLGTISSRSGNREDALRHYGAARALYGHAGDHQSSAAVEALEAEIEGLRGNSDAAFALFAHSATTLRQYPQSVWLHTALFASARLASRFGLYRAGIRFHGEDAGVVAQMRRPMYDAEARIGYAEALARAGRIADARAQLGEARRSASVIEPGPLRNTLFARLRLGELSAQELAPRDSASRALDSLVTFFESEKNTAWILRVRLMRAESHMRRKEGGAAALDLDSAIALLVHERDDAQLLSSRATIAGLASSAVNRMVMLQISQGNAGRAAQYLEAGRVALAPAYAAAPAHPGAAMPLPPGTTVADYALIGDTLLVWVFHGASVTLSRQTVDRRQLLSEIGVAHAALELGSSDTILSRTLGSLYAALAAPAVSSASSGDEMVFVADGALARVPFAALFNAARRRYLVEDFAVRTVSAMADVHTLRSLGAERDHRAVLVADPAFDARAFPGLVALPGARAEVADIAGEYATAIVLQGERATRPAVSRALADGGVLHFAGHAVFDDAHPGESYLLLAGDSASPSGSRWTAADISARDFKRTTLVVLSACETARAPQDDARGFGGLAGAFLAAGAAGVVGTLWRIDDATAHSLTAGLHREYRTQRAGPDALRAAQLALLHSSNPAMRHPASWAAFQYVGN